MGRLLLFLGFIVLALAIAIILGVTLGMQTETFSDYMSPIFCNSEETIVTETRRNFNSEQTVDVFCQVNEENRRDVTGQVVLWLGGSFAGTLVLSIILMIVGGSIMAKRRAHDMINTFQTFTVQSGQPQSYDLRQSMNQIPPEAMEIVKTVMGSMGMTQSTFEGQSLTERLQQLEDARNQGLISQSEYDRVRTAILDRMDD